MQQLSCDDEAEFPIAAKIIRTNLYVDDLISGGDSYEEVVEIRQQVKELLDRGHFPIPKWCSNEPAALNGIKARRMIQRRWVWLGILYRIICSSAS